MFSNQRLMLFLKGSWLLYTFKTQKKMQEKVGVEPTPLPSWCRVDISFSLAQIIKNKKIDFIERVYNKD